MNWLEPQYIAHISNNCSFYMLEFKNNNKKKQKLLG